ncbi:hypothetical protein PHET_07160 [Paragonimus heterotremus]|uniref:Uncharacterized protein n=1 Tax=Paragonimus heterotremus TaxID=100268 RepID=A0A8J4SMQ5_9TREM|nr:hypothetical protein PHET_07160 [Paragonimus heterotremus]
MMNPSSFQWYHDFEPSRTPVSSYTESSEVENPSASRIVDPASNHSLVGLYELLHCAGVIQEELVRHETLLSDYLSSDTAADCTYTDDLKFSLRNLNEQTKRLIDAIQRTSQEIELIRNDSLSQVREFHCLKATLAEAERQLEESAEYRCQLHSLKEAHRLLQLRFEAGVSCSHCSSECRTVWSDPSSVYDLQANEEHFTAKLPDQSPVNSPIWSGDSGCRPALYKSVIVQRMQSELQSTKRELNSQIEQTNELEALLAERDSRLIAQAHELDDVESQLIASTTLIDTLNKRLTSNHHQLTHFLQQLKENSSQTHEPPGCLPAVPAVLDLVATLDTTYAELQEAERLRMVAEKKASSATKTARELRNQLREITERSADFPLSHCSLIDPMIMDATTQTFRCISHCCATQTDEVPGCTPNDSLLQMAKDDNSLDFLSTDKPDQISPYAFSRPDTVLAQSLHPKHSDSEQVVALQEALRNAISQINRLNRYRLSQKNKITQLQQRLHQLNSELDATVDALRYHQTSSETERHRTVAEIAGLRTQLAKATALLSVHSHHRMTGSSAVVCSQTPRASSAGPISVKPQTALSSVALTHPSADDRVCMDLALAQTELSQLRVDMARVKADNDRELTKLRGQLAESTADGRALRLQVVRLQNALESATGRSTDGTGNGCATELLCSNCQRLEKLLTIIQQKHCSYSTKVTTSIDTQTSQTSSPDQSVQCRSVSVQWDLISANSAGIGLNSDSEYKVVLDSGITAVEDYTGTTDDSTGHLHFQSEKERNRLQSERDEFVAELRALHSEREQYINQRQQAEAEVDQLRSTLANERLSLIEQQSRLEEERQYLRAGRDRLARLEVELLEKRKEAEMLVLLATEEQSAALVLKKQLNGKAEEKLFAAVQSRDVTPQPAVVDVPSSTGGCISRVMEERAVQTDLFERLACFLQPLLPVCDQVIFLPHSPLFPRIRLPGDYQPNVSHVPSFPFGLIGEFRPNFETEMSDLFRTELSVNSQSKSFQELTEELISLRVYLRNQLQSLEREKSEIRAQKENLARAAPPVPPAECDVVGGKEVSSNASVESHISQEQLLVRLRQAEQEAEDAILQLRASNAEFLALRERVSHAMVERAYLKSTVEALDEQVSQLESSLFERTQQLNQCRAELTRISPTSVTTLPNTFRSMADVSLLCGLSQKLGCNKFIRLLVSSRQTRCAEYSEPSFLPLLETSKTVPYHQFVSCRSLIRTQLARTRMCIANRIPTVSLKRTLCCTRFTLLRSRLLLQSQPRRTLIFGLLFYLMFLHMWLIRCWLF